MELFLFALLATTACGGALAVVLSQNVVRMAFWLVVSLAGIAGLFFLLHADFVGAVQLLVYVGGTVVLLVFGVMLTASAPVMAIRSSPADVALASAIGAAFLGMLAFTVMKVDWDTNASKLEGRYGVVSSDRPGYNEQGEGQTVRQIGTALLGVRFDRDLGRSGSAPSTGYLLPFEIVSVHLLVVLIGAAYLARRSVVCSRRVVSHLFREDHRRMSAVGLNGYLLVGAFLFVCGIVCMTTKRNGIGVLMGVELVLNGANVNFVAFSRHGSLGLDGQVAALFVIVLAAAEAAVALAIALNFYNNHDTIDVDRADELRG